MEKTIAILMTATLMLTTGFILVTLAGGGLSDFGDNANQTGQNVRCQYQIDQLEENDAEPGEIDQDCGAQMTQQQESSFMQSWGQENIPTG